MALSKTSLKQKLETELKAQGFVLDGEFAMAGMMVRSHCECGSERNYSERSSGGYRGELEGKLPSEVALEIIFQSNYISSSHSACVSVWYFYLSYQLA